MANIDYRFAIELLVPNAEYGWLSTDADNINGQYEWIDWRDKRKKPTRAELEKAWNDYVTVNGTPDQQETQKKTEREAALARLATKADQDIIDLLKIIS